MPFPAKNCLACGGDDFQVVENVTVQQLARAWATDRKLHSAPCSGQESTRHLPTADEVAEWATSIRKALGADEVRFDRCQQCGLEVATPSRPWPSGAYPEDEHHPVRWEFDRLLDDLGKTPLRVLELGCGAGQFLARAGQRGYDALGIDFSSVAVDKAREQNLQAFLGGFDELRAHLNTRGATQPFDAVALFHAIEHLSAPGEVLRQLREFVRRDTKLGISCPGPNRFTRLIGVQQVGNWDFWDYPPHHVLRWSIPALRTFLEGNGWEVVSAQEEPLISVHAAAQMGSTRALWGGYIGSRWRTRLAILMARLRLLIAGTTYRGLSLYILASYKG